MTSLRLITCLIIALLLLAGCGSENRGRNEGSFTEYGLQEGDFIMVEIMGGSGWSDSTASPEGTDGSSGTDSGADTGDTIVHGDAGGANDGDGSGGADEPGVATTNDGTADGGDTGDATQFQPGQKSAVLDAGTTLQLSVVARDVAGTTEPDVAVNWYSDNTEIATVDNTGKITGVSPGEVGITVQLLSTVTGDIISDSIVVTVLPSPVENITWVKGRSMPLPMWDHASTVWGGYLYIAGGHSSCSPLDFSDCGFTDKVYYAPVHSDGSIGEFRQTMPLPRTLRGHSILAYNNYLYLIGGIVQPFFPEPPYPDSSKFETILNEQVYYAGINPDGSLGEWIKTVPLSPSRIGLPDEKAGLFALSAAVHKGYIFVTGGWSSELKENVPTVLTGPIDKEDGSIISWIHNIQSDLPYDLSKHAAVAASVNNSDYIYIIGGNSGNIGTQEFHKEIYFAKIAEDGILSTWKLAGQSLPVQLIDHAAAAAGKYIFVLGGRDGDGGSDEKIPYNKYSRVYCFAIDATGDLQPLNRLPDIPSFDTGADNSNDGRADDSNAGDGTQPLFHHAAIADMDDESGNINIYITGGASGNTKDQENRKNSIYYLTDIKE